MPELQTCTALATGPGAGYFLRLSVRDALVSGALCSAHADGDFSELARVWYTLRFRWKNSALGEAIRVGVDENDQVVAAETWLLSECDAPEKFGPLPSLLHRIRSTNSIRGFRTLGSDDSGELLAMEFEFDTGQRLAFRHNWPVSCSP